MTDRNAIRSYMVTAQNNPYFRWVFDFDPKKHEWRRETQMFDTTGEWVVRGVITGIKAQEMAVRCGITARDRQQQDQAHRP